MHPNNIHNKPYDFVSLIKAYPELKPYVFTNDYSTETIDFANPKAILALNKAILLHYYGLTDWNIPDGYLCSPIPGRADYIHHLNDLLKTEENSTPNKGLDIGTGANCIYPLLAATIYDWHMLAVDIDEVAVASAKNNIALNPQLSNNIAIQHQPNNANIFKGIVQEDAYFDFTMCNPPFHTSKEEAHKHALQKTRNLNSSSTLNFGGQSNELWCNGGEALFIKRMIKQSVAYAKQVGFFTTLVSKSENLPQIKKQLIKLKASYSIISMTQGNKKSRIVAWSFKD